MITYEQYSSLTLRIENLQFIISDMKNEIVHRAQHPRKPGSPLNEKFKNMAKPAFG